MRKFIIILFLIFSVSKLFAQKTALDSLREVLRQDSIEYNKEMDELDKQKLQTDSIINNQVGTVPDISDKKIDSAALKRQIAAYIQKKKEEEEANEKNISTRVGIAVIILLAGIIFFFKRKPSGGRNR